MNGISLGQGLPSIGQLAMGAVHLSRELLREEGRVVARVMDELAARELAVAGVGSDAEFCSQIRAMFFSSTMH